MHQISLLLKNYEGQERLFASFGYNLQLINIVKNIQGSKYSAGLKSWHFPLIKDVALQLIDKTKGLAIVNTCELKKQLIERRSQGAIENKLSVNPDIRYLCKENGEALNRYIETLILKNLASNTQKTYITIVR